MRRTQEGMASIVVVSILIIVLTLISIGFARLMNRTLTNAAARQASTAANYAAQSAINDVAGYLKQYVASNPPPAPQPKSDKCKGAGSLIGSDPPGAAGPFYSDSNLSGDSATKYTCLLLNPTPTDIVYQQINSNKSQVVKLTTSAFPGSLDKLMVSWQPSNNSVSGYPAATDCPVSGGVCSSASFKDATTWNSAANNFVPMLRLTIFPVPTYTGTTSDSAKNLQANSKTVFLYPQAASGNVPVKSYSGLTDGTIIPVPCTKTVGTTASIPDFNGTADDTCNIILSNLASFFTAPDSIDYVYLRLTPIYNQADVKIKANDRWQQTLTFLNVQAMIDATAQSGGVAKRLQARVDTSSLSSSGSGTDYNISSSSNAIPEQSVRTANALCKRLVQTVSFYSYVSFDTSPAVCHDTSSGNVSNPIPSLDLSITGFSGPDSYSGIANKGVAKHYSDLTPDANAKGITYIDGGGGVGGNITLNWTTKDATSCTASGGSAGWASPPDKNGLMSFSGSPAINGAGSQSFSGITNYTNYILQCSRVGGGNSPYASITNAEGPETVAAWPPPKVDFNGTTTSYNAGGTYTIKWNSYSASTCTVSSTGNQPWNQTYSNLTPGSDTKSNTFGTSWADNTAKSYIVTCKDPINRSASATWTVGSGGSGGGTTILPPSCSKPSINPSIGNGSGTFSWNGSCPDVSPGSGYYRLHDCTNIDCASIGSSGWVGQSGTGPSLGPGHYCADIMEGADPWGTLNDSGQVCWNIPTASISFAGFNNNVSGGHCNDCTANFNYSSSNVSSCYIHLVYANGEAADVPVSANTSSNAPIGDFGSPGGGHNSGTAWLYCNGPSVTGGPTYTSTASPLFPPTCSIDGVGHPGTELVSGHCNSDSPFTAHWHYNASYTDFKGASCGAPSGDYYYPAGNYGSLTWGAMYPTNVTHVSFSWTLDATNAVGSGSAGPVNDTWTQAGGIVCP